MTMESLKFPKFTQKLAELKKAEIAKVDEMLFLLPNLKQLDLNS